MVGPLLSRVLDKPPTCTFGLAMVLSTIALTRKSVFNGCFERWESRQRCEAARGPGAWSMAPEAGLVINLRLVMSLRLEISAAATLAAKLGCLLFSLSKLSCSPGALNGCLD